MKKCRGKFHGKVEKFVEDDEDYCPLCKARMEAIKKEKAEKWKNYLKKIVQGVLAVVPIVLLVIGWSRKKNNDNS